MAILVRWTLQKQLINDKCVCETNSIKSLYSDDINCNLEEKISFSI